MFASEKCFVEEFDPASFWAYVLRPKFKGRTVRSLGGYNYNDPLQKNTYLVGGFNPFEKYATVKLEINLPPKVRGVKIPKKSLKNPPPRYETKPTQGSVLIG